MKASEKRLLAVFVGLLFLGVNWLLFQRFVDYTSTYDADLDRLTTRRAQLQKLATERPEWLDRKNWVTRTLPLYSSIDDRDTYLINFVRKAASEASVEIDRGPENAPTEIEGHYEKTGVSVTVVGEVQPITNFLFRLQEPSSYRALTSFRLTPAKKGESALRCEVSLEQWWALNSLAATSAAAAPPAPGTAPEFPTPSPGQTPPTPGSEITPPTTDNG